MSLLWLPLELLYKICLQLSLKDIQKFLLTNSFLNNNIKINWYEYFIYHTNINIKILNNFKVVNKDFMIEHGRYLLKKPLNIIEQYLILWPKLIELNLLNNAIEYVRYRENEFSIEDNSIEILQFYLKEKSGRFIAIYFHRNNEDGKMQYSRVTDSELFMPTIIPETIDISFLYEECKNILLNNNLYYLTTILGIHAKIFKIGLEK